jgi:tetratricopeptide (TPR) repeat protein
VSTTLSQLPSVRVIARTSAFSFRGRNVDVREIGRQLSATHLLEGSVRRSGDTVRVTAQLVDTAHGYNHWSQAFDLPARDVLRLQSDIARSVAAALEIRFPEAGWKRLAKRGAADGEAYELYLRARHYYRQRTPEGIARAIELNARAIDLDPKFALGHVGLAQAHFNEFAVAHRPVHELSGKVDRLLQRALQIDSDLPDAYVARGALRREQNRLSEARTDLQHAIRLDPNNVEAIVNLGRVHEYEGLPSLALERFDQAGALDPLDFMRHLDRCVALQDLGRYEQAAAACAEARTLKPDSEWAYIVSGWLARAQGQIAQSLYWNTEALRVAPSNPDLYQQRVDDLFDLGLFEEARTSLQRVQSLSDDSTYSQLRYADLLLVQRGASAARDYLTGISFADDPGVLDLMDGAQVSLSAGDLSLARRLAEKAQSAPDHETLGLSERVWIKLGSSPALTLAAIEQHTGHSQDARRRLSTLVELLDAMERNGYTSWGIHSVRAEALALLGDHERAISELDRAADLGWRSTWSALHDPYFEALRSRKEFRDVIARVERMNVTERERYSSATEALAQL